MLDNTIIFDPEKISIVEYKILKNNINTPDDFQEKAIIGYEVENTLQLYFNIEEKLIKADFITNIKTDSNNKNSTETEGVFHLIFIYRIENMEELVKPLKKNLIDLNPMLGNAISAITYSTTRGILMMHLQGTVLQNFILQIINPNKLIKYK